ncbi:tyrosine-protein phosphatase [Companilactobacillus kimchii]|uniref:Protein-tyrosine-phosphatase n=2 Tax=Companilactobacillus kimchii TaxID=2801452 RepID=A0ABR5NSM9_9LACO|nr:tyrosine-protein phosphatase [Companilactobacillus kimchii]KAE9562207.1 hypothetical protein ATN91_06355 [Companilactobacillus kimchii]KRK51172.1 protein-tyrosine-phosphatase [Companilactobacillus kimchii DSM 13961 = JCM 10707]OWF34346.1 Protein-tyrosine-phosphatase [Companilactobacillus kimchii]GEO46268.1 protein-tyrosine-phosphatase [Companilactobacillus paralimentarius]
MIEQNNTHFISLQGTFNTRDLGGYQTESGKYVKKNRLFRSDDLYKLTISDIKWFEDHGLTTVIDFRNFNERKNRPDKIIKGVKYYDLSPDDETAALASADLKSDKKKIDKLIEKKKQNKLDLTGDGLKKSMVGFVRDSETQKLYRQVLEIHIKENNDVILQHCRGGKDRTGYGSALVLLALGVSEDDVISDYMLTAKYNADRNKRRMNEYRKYTKDPVVLKYLSNAMSTRKEVIEAGINEMKKISVSPIQYIQNELGFDKDKISYLRSIYLR